MPEWSSTKVWFVINNVHFILSYNRNVLKYESKGLIMKAFDGSKYLAAVVNGEEGIIVVERLAEALGLKECRPARFQRSRVDMNGRSIRTPRASPVSVTTLSVGVHDSKFGYLLTGR